MQEDFQVIFIVVIGTLLLILLVGFIVLSVYFYQRTQHRHSQDLADLKNSVQKEILIAQLEIKENTLNTISQEIHDNIGQVLSLAKLNLNTVLIHEASSLDKITSTKDLIGKAIQDLRNLSKTLNSEYISEHSLSQLLQADIDTIEKSGDYKAELHIIGEERMLDPQHQLIIYRIFQEVLNNIIKHAKGDRIRILFDYSTNPFQLSIQDNGIGFGSANPAELRKTGNGSGLYNIQNRARLIGAELTYESTPNAGTTVKLAIPIS